MATLSELFSNLSESSTQRLYLLAQHQNTVHILNNIHLWRPRIYTKRESMLTRTLLNTTRVSLYVFYSTITKSYTRRWATNTFRVRTLISII